MISWQQQQQTAFPINQQQKISKNHTTKHSEQVFRPSNPPPPPPQKKKSFFFFFLNNNHTVAIFTVGWLQDTTWKNIIIHAAFRGSHEGMVGRGGRSRSGGDPGQGEIQVRGRQQGDAGICDDGRNWRRGGGYLEGRRGAGLFTDSPKYLWCLVLNNNKLNPTTMGGGGGGGVNLTYHQQVNLKNNNNKNMSTQQTLEWNQ